MWRRTASAALGGLGIALTLGSALAAPPEPEHKRTSERVSERVSRGAIQEGLETLEDPENQARLGKILNSPDTRAAIHDLAASLVLGLFDGIREARASGTASDADISKSIARSIDKRITPALGRMSYRIVGAAVSAALTDEQIVRMQTLSEGAAHAIVRGAAKGLHEDVGPGLAITIERDLGPALALIIERDLLPAVGRGLETPEMQEALTIVARSAATGIVEGAGEAIDVKTDANKAEGRDSGLQVFGDRVAVGYGVAMFVAFAFGTLVVVLTVLLLRNSRRLRKQSEAAKQRESALLSLVDSLETENPELKADMRSLLHAQLDPAR